VLVLGSMMLGSLADRLLGEWIGLWPTLLLSALIGRLREMP
jgi:hypothetical protein